MEEIQKAIKVEINYLSQSIFNLNSPFKLQLTKPYFLIPKGSTCFPYISLIT